MDFQTLFMLFIVRPNRYANLFFLDYVPRSGNILDYGCGTAYVFFKAKRKRCDINIHLADIPEAVTKEFAEWRFNKYKLEYNWYDIPKNEKLAYDTLFDYIRCHEVLEHTFHPDVVIEKFFSSLRLGGFLSFDFLKDTVCRKENTKQSQDLRDVTLKYVKKNCEIVYQKRATYLVRKPQK